jgi:hypothetical protein
MTTSDAFDELADHPDLETVFGAAREERRREEEEFTRAAARQWARHRDLLDVLREFQHRGDTVSVRLGATAFVGVIDAVGRDYVQLRMEAGRIDIRFPRSADERAPFPPIVRVLERAREGGRRAEPGAQTFRARLLEYDGDEVDAVVGSVLPTAELRGRITVGRDHVVVRDRDGGETYLPLNCVAWVKPWRE